MNFGNVEIGVNSAEVNTYLQKIQAEVIETAKQKLWTEQTALFEAFRQNWKGQAEANFEANMTAATQQVFGNLQKSYEALESKIYAIHNSWINQDQEMVQLKGGNE